MNRTADNLFILRIDCPDRPGIVAAVAGFLRDRNFNIEEAAQFNDRLSQRFFMRVVLRPLQEESAVREKFRTHFTPLAEEFSMVWHLDGSGEKVKTLIMVSKADHCLNDIFYRWRTGHLPLDIRGVVSNHETCRSLAEDRGLAFIHLPVTPATKMEQEHKLAGIVEETGAEVLVLARYMQILSDAFCGRYPGRVINIHHSFLPGFKGARPYHQAYERGVKIIGATAHFVTSDLDEGPIIEQETVRIDHTMAPPKLQVLGRDIEARVLSRALSYYCERRIFLQGSRTVIL